MSEPKPSHYYRLSDTTETTSKDGVTLGDKGLLAPFRLRIGVTLQRNQHIAWCFEDGTYAGPASDVFPPLAKMTVSVIFPDFVTVWLDDPPENVDDIQTLRRDYVTEEWFIPD
jgi:hypothetical protein